MARYELLERIGIGGMAEIFRGTATAGGGFEKLVAIKRILPHLSKDQRFIELLIAEAKILSELHHRNIVQIYDVGLGDDEQYFLVMEFVDGTDLKKVYETLFDGRRLPVEVALHICSEICEALEHAHKARDGEGNNLSLVHRDVSPSNVLLSRSGEVKLTDFGIAKRMEEVTGHGGVRGKFAYISPEQAVNKHVDGRSDVFSVGILLYELVCGQRLYSALADFDALREVREGRVRPRAEHIAGVPPELAKIVMTALSKNPMERYQSAGDFGSALRGYRYSLETEMPDPSAEIAALVSRQIGVPPSEQDLEEPDEHTASDRGATVVRINTAAQFSSSDLSGLHQLVSSYPQPRFADESLDLSDTLGGSLQYEGGPTVAGHLPSATGDEEATLQSSAFLEAKTRLHPSTAAAFADDSVDSAFDHDSLDSGADAAASDGLDDDLMAKTHRLDARQAAAAMPDLVAASKNTSEKSYPTHLAALGTSPPAAVARPHILGPDVQQRQRRIRLGLIGASVVLVALLTLGHFMGKKTKAAKSSKIDAGVAIDAGVPDAAPPPDAAVKAKKKQRRRNNKRRRKRRNRKRTTKKSAKRAGKTADRN